jgi:acylphosphatase
VQGVFFRASTQRQAIQLGLTGHALNLTDGRVEVLAQGSLEAMQQLADWLQVGPPAADVTKVEEMPAEVADSEDRSGFSCG